MAQDFGNPKILTGQARETISGGQLVGVSGATGVVSSGLNSYATSDIKFILNTAPENFVGVAIATVTSGQELGVLVEGVVLSRCVGSVFAGLLVKGLIDSFSNVGSSIVPANAEDASMAGDIAGRAFTAGASGGFALIYVHA